MQQLPEPNRANFLEAVPISASPFQTPSRASKTLQRVLKFVKTVGIEEIKKLPGGSVIEASVDLVADLAGEESGKKDGEQIERLLANTEQAAEMIKALGQIATMLFLQQAELLVLVRNGDAEDIGEDAKELALLAYRASLAREYCDVDRRLAGDDYTTRHIALLPLDDVYVTPNLAPEHDAEHAREREVLRELEERAEYLNNQDRVQLEGERDLLLDARWQRFRERRADSNTGDPLGQALSSARRLVVLGGPGSGKSTMVRYISRACALGEEAMQRCFGWSEEVAPVVVPLALFAEARRTTPALSLHAFLEAQWSENGGAALKAALNETLTANRTWVLLDGVDEAPSDSLRLGVVQAIEGFLGEHQNVRCLITSRPIGYVRIQTANLPHLQLPPFTPKQVDQFVRSWHEALAKRLNPAAPDLDRARHEADAMLNNIRQNAQVTELATNPLMLVIFGLLSLNGTPLPERRVELYQKVVHLLIGAWNERRAQMAGVRADTSLERSGLIELLGAVAAWIRAERKGRIVSRADLRRKMAEVLREREDDQNAEATAESYLDAAAKRAGVLEECGHDWFTFWHPTFEEYLAAVELATPTNRATANLLPHRSDPRFREVILLAVGYIGLTDKTTATDLIRVLWRDSPGSLEGILHENLLLAVDCIADLRESVRAHLTAEIALTLAGLLEAQPFAPIITAFAKVARAVPRLAATRPEIIPALEVLTNHPNWEVRMETARLLAQAAPDNDRARTLCERLLQQEEEDVRCHAALGLARSGEDSPAIWKGLLAFGNVSAQISSEAMDFFRREPERTGQNMLLLLSSNDDFLRFRAAALLVQAGQLDQALPTLLSLLNSKDDSLRFRAATLLVQAGQLDQVRPTLLQRLSSNDNFLRSQAADFLVQAGQLDQALPTLLSLLNSKNDSLRFGAATLLVQAGTLEAQARGAIVMFASADADTAATRAFEAAWRGDEPLSSKDVDVLGRLLQIAESDTVAQREAKEVLFNLLHEAKRPPQRTADV